MSYATALNWYLYTGSPEDTPPVGIPMNRWRAMCKQIRSRLGQ